MVKVTSFTKTGTKQQTEAPLDAAVFGVRVNPELVGLAYRAYMAAGRTAHAATLSRGQVRGGGRKPWRQKGTGRARAGSIRIPHWRGGGVVFGPTGQENYQIKVPVAMKRAAIRQALSLKAKAQAVAVIEAFEVDGRVKSILPVLGKLEADGNILLVADKLTDHLDRSTRNLSGITTVEAKYLNVFIIMNADRIFITKPALTIISHWLGETKSAPAAKPAEPAS